MCPNSSTEGHSGSLYRTSLEKPHLKWKRSPVYFFLSRKVDFTSNFKNHGLFITIIKIINLYYIFKCEETAAAENFDVLSVQGIHLTKISFYWQTEVKEVYYQNCAG